MKYDNLLNNRLESEIDEKFATFSRRIMQTDKLLGVKVPVLRKIAREFSNYDDFFNTVSLDNFDVRMEKINSPFIFSFNTEEKFTSKSRLIRYHYTSADALINILSSNPTLRFTDIGFMNDHSEMVYCVKCILDFLLKNKSKYPYSLELVNELLLKKHTAEEYRNLTLTTVDFTEFKNLPFIPPRAYVFCMSESDDSLNMWNYYVHNGKYEGYNIGFDVYEFLKSFDTSAENKADPIIFHYGKVLYTLPTQEREVKSFLDEIEKNKSSKYIDRICDMALIRRYIEAFGVFFKNEAFEHEKEYRIVLSIAEDRLNSDRENYFNENLKRMNLDFRSKNGIIVPYFELPINKDAIKQITISPTIEKHVAQKGLEDLLHKNGYSAIIKQSKIPVRF